jgi:hypothetical protein
VVPLHRWTARQRKDNVLDDHWVNSGLVQHSIDAIKQQIIELSWNVYADNWCLFNQEGPRKITEK